MEIWEQETNSYPLKSFEFLLLCGIPNHSLKPLLISTWWGKGFDNQKVN